MRLGWCCRGKVGWGWGRGQAGNSGGVRDAIGGEVQVASPLGQGARGEVQVKMKVKMQQQQVQQLLLVRAGWRRC